MQPDCLVQALHSERSKTLRALTDAPLDVLIIGGGIVGAGIARDAAMRGLKTGLVEQHDFAFGTSGRSSRLFHGGLRYLAQGRLGLVHEASMEKKIIHQIAPHLAEPLPFIFPTYRGNKNWVLWQLKIGVKIYDLLCGGRNLGKSTWLNRVDVQSKVPALTQTNLTGAVRYFDGFTNDARLVIDTLRSAHRHGAALVNYARVEKATRTQLWECTVVDKLSSQLVQVCARTVVNATGPWAEGLPHSKVKLRLTKGIHLVVDHARVPVTDTVVMTEGKRILFAIPWGERTILGTTDTDYAGDLDRVFAEATDIEYVLQITNSFFPSAKLETADVVSSWAGLRPLLADPNGKPSDISRSHEIRSPKPGWWDVAGGKLTTYRLMAEEAVNQLVSWLRRDNATNGQFAPCRTAREPLLPATEADANGILPPKFDRSVVERACAREWAVHLDDVMLRRTGWHYYHRDAGEKAERVADWMSEILDWNSAQRREELDRYQKLTGASIATSRRIATHASARFTIRESTLHS